MRRLLIGFIGLAMTAGPAEAAFTLTYGSTIRTEDVSLVAIGDVTGDKKNDLVTIVGDEVHVYERLPDGNFSEPRKYRYTGSGWADYAHELELADINRDGIKDIVIGGSGTLALALLKSNKLQPAQLLLETFANHNMQSQNSGGIAVTDINGDGLPDVIQAVPQTWPSSYIRVWRGYRSTLANRSALPGLPSGYLSSVVTGFMDVRQRDMNGDGLEDLAVPTSGYQFSIYYRDGVNGFNPTPVTHNRSACCYFAVGDFNGDGRADATSSAGLNAPTNIELQLQQSSGQFAPAIMLPTDDRPGVMQGEDIDGDGDDDLVVLHQGDGVGVYLQEQNDLQPETTYGFYGGDAFAIGDLNSDGCKDIAYAVRSLGLYVYHGNGCQQPSFEKADLSVALAGSPAAVSVGLANSPGTESIESPLVQLDLSVRMGTLQTGTLPVGCALQSQTARAQRIECLVDTLTPESTASLTIPVSFTGAGKPGALMVTVQARTDTREKTISNNRAWRQITQQAVASSLVSRPVQSASRPSRPALLQATTRSRSMHGKTQEHDAPSKGVMVEREARKLDHTHPQR